MIPLNKIPEPQILTNNKTKWTKEYLSALKKEIPMTNTIRNRYKRKEIKEALIKETSGKCAYCESKLLHISYGDIEHILPKSKYPELYVEWTNLTLSCELCNRNGKNDYYDKENPLLNPYIDNPYEHLLAYGPIMMNHNGSHKGDISIKILNLNRTSLIEKRKERIENINLLVNKYHNETNPQIKKLLKSELLKECEPDKEFSFFIKSYLKSEFES